VGTVRYSAAVIDDRSIWLNAISLVIATREQTGHSCPQAAHEAQLKAGTIYLLL
jgi:hypothetical protein